VPVTRDLIALGLLFGALVRRRINFGHRAEGINGEGRMPERVRFERELEDLGLREYEAPVQANRHEVVVGEKIELDIKAFVPVGVDIINVQWTIPDTAVASYWDDRKGSEQKELAGSLNKSSLTFYWVDGGVKEVKVHYTLKYSSSLQVPSDIVFPFDVKAPKLDRFDAKTSTPRIAKERGLPVIRFGTLDKKAPGIKWDWQVTMPTNHGGWIKDLQTILIRQEKTQLVDKKSTKTRNLVRKHPRKGQHEQLDQDFIDEGTEATYSSKGRYPPIAFPTKVEAGKSFRDTATWDSPGTLLEALDISTSVNNSFKYYILYKPDTKGAIWVPVARAEWFWQAEAVKQKGSWILKSKSGKVSVPGAPTVKFPLYGSNKNESDWIEEP
jgi:hypothetical protein